MQILLVDREAAMVRAWRAAFDDRDDVEVVEGDYFSRRADAMVSPANSFGVMDGGLDAAIRDVLGFAVQQRAQRAIVERHHGELPVGSAELIETNDERWPILVVAPTKDYEREIRRVVPEGPVRLARATRRRTGTFPRRRPR